MIKSFFFCCSFFPLNRFVCHVQIEISSQDDFFVFERLFQDCIDECFFTHAGIRIVDVRKPFQEEIVVAGLTVDIDERNVIGQGDEKCSF